MFSGGRAPEFFDRNYKIEHTADHVATFDGDRPRELGDLALKKKQKKETAVKYKSAENYRSGRPKNSKS